MELNDRINEALTQFGQLLITDLRQSLKNKGVSFGGQDSKLSAQIRFEITKTETGTKFLLKMPDYSEYLDKGRGPTVNKNSPPKVQPAIESWVKRKGMVGKFQSQELESRLKKQSQSKREGRKKLKKLPFEAAAKALSYMISRKIHKKGYKAREFYSSVVDDGRLQTLESKLSALVKDHVQIEITNIL